MVAAINGVYTDYSALNGIAGSYDGLSNTYSGSSLPIFNSYGMGGYWGGGDIEQAKENLQNNYEYNSLYQAYGNKQSAQNLNFTTSCQDISNLLAQGRTDEAMKLHSNLLNTMRNLPQYQECSEAQLKDMLRQQYTYSTGSDLVSDIQTNASGSFVQGLKQGIPILGTFFANGNSKDDATAQVTNYNQSAGSKAAKVTGSLISGIGVGASIGTIPIFAPFGGPIAGAIVGGIVALGKTIFDKK